MQEKINKLEKKYKRAKKAVLGLGITALVLAFNKVEFKIERKDTGDDYE